MCNKYVQVHGLQYLLFLLRWEWGHIIREQQLVKHSISASSRWTRCRGQPSIGHVNGTLRFCLYNMEQIKETFKWGAADTPPIWKQQYNLHWGNRHCKFSACGCHSPQEPKYAKPVTTTAQVSVSFHEQQTQQCYEFINGVWTKNKTCTCWGLCEAVWRSAPSQQQQSSFSALRNQQLSGWYQ